MSPRSLTRALTAALAVVATVAAVFFLWPLQLGGWTGYAVIDGTSMEPRLQTGDLIVTRKRADYGVGDAVLYQSDRLRSHVYHRIVALRGDGFVIRGDNRTENDAGVVPRSKVLGSEWLVVPGAGRPLHWLSHPLNLAIVCFVLLLLALGGGREITRRRRRGVDPPPIAAEPSGEPSAPATTTAGRGLLVAGIVAALAFGALAIVAWTRDATTQRTLVGAYAHEGTFSYTAAARPGAAYPDGVTATGQPVFLRLSDRVDVAFDYRFVTDRPSNLRGGIALDAVVSDGQGWSRTLPLATERPFAGTGARVVGRLDLRRLSGLLARVRLSTGESLTQANVTVIPRVTVAGYAGDDVLDDRFAPRLPLTLDSIALRLVGPGDVPAGVDGAAAPAASSLSPREPGSSVVSVPARLSLGPVAGLDVQRTRSLSLVGLVAALGALALGAGLLLRRRPSSEADRIEERYGSRIVRARATIPEGRWVTELHDVESLIRLAETYDRVVLRVSDADGGSAFLVDDGIAVYRYRPVPGGALGTPRALPAHGR